MLTKLVMGAAAAALLIGSASAETVRDRGTLHRNSVTAPYYGTHSDNGYRARAQVYDPYAYNPYYVTPGVPYPYGPYPDRPYGDPDGW